MIELTEQQQTLLTRCESPPRVVNPATKETFVLIRAEVYAKFQDLLGEEDVRDLETLLAELSPEDWEDASNYEHKP